MTRYPAPKLINHLSQAIISQILNPRNTTTHAGSLRTLSRFRDLLRSGFQRPVINLKILTSHTGKSLNQSKTATFSASTREANE